MRDRRLAPDQQIFQARVQRSVRERMKRSQYRTDPLAQLIAVHGRSIQDPEHGQLQYPGSLTCHIATPACRRAPAAVRMLNEDL